MHRAVRYDEVGGPEVLALAHIDDAEPADERVVVRVRAAGLNPYDAKVRGGVVPSKAAFPRKLGSDLAGTVEAVGAGAVYWDGTPVRVGDEVFGSGLGALAERVVARASSLARRPDGVPVEVAGGLHVIGIAAASSLLAVPVSADDTVLVGGASGAVGFTVAQLARAAGARVLGSASPRNFDALRAVGIEPVEYGEGLTERVAALGAPTAVIDTHGRAALDVGAALGVPGERMTATAAGDAIAELGARELVAPEGRAATLADLAARVASGDLAVPIAATYPLDEVVAAFTELEGSHAMGKIVVLP
ncbi:MAG: NADP-dependent oxidoreductase [Pseudoclavibacter sp.]